MSMYTLLAVLVTLSAVRGNRYKTYQDLYDHEHESNSDYLPSASNTKIEYPNDRHGSRDWKEYDHDNKEPKPSAWKTDKPTPHRAYKTPKPTAWKNDKPTPHKHEKTPKPTKWVKKAYKTEKPSAWKKTEHPTKADKTPKPTYYKDEKTPRPTYVKTQKPTHERTAKPTYEKTRKPTPYKDEKTPKPTEWKKTQKPTALKTDKPTHARTPKPTRKKTRKPTPYKDAKTPKPTAWKKTRKPTVWQTPAPSELHTTHKPTVWQTPKPTPHPVAWKTIAHPTKWNTEKPTEYEPKVTSHPTYHDVVRTPSPDHSQYIEPTHAEAPKYSHRRLTETDESGLVSTGRVYGIEVGTFTESPNTASDNDYIFQINMRSAEHFISLQLWSRNEQTRDSGFAGQRPVGSSNPGDSDSYRVADDGCVTMVRVWSEGQFIDGLQFCSRLDGLKVGDNGNLLDCSQVYGREVGTRFTDFIPRDQSNGITTCLKKMEIHYGPVQGVSGFINSLKFWYHSSVEDLLD